MKTKGIKRQEIRSVERGYLSHCFKSRHVTLATPHFGVIHTTCSNLSNRENMKSLAPAV